MRRLTPLAVAFAAAILCFGISSASATSSHPGAAAASGLVMPTPRLLSTGESIERSVLRRMRAERKSAARAAASQARAASNYHPRVLHARSSSVTARRLQAAPPTCDGRVATIVGTEGNDTINGTAGRDVIVGLGGDDTIYG
jgi:RTX calcium-binding nonapeptide repeat (4 copies)